MQHEEQQYRQVRRVRSALAQNTDILPLCVEIHPTDRCNHRCAWCFHGGGGHDPARRDETLSISEYEKLFSDMQRLGIRELSIAGGGEPTLDPRLPTIIDAAVTRGLRTRLVTHGNLFSASLLPRLLRCNEVRVSLDAATAPTYAKARQVPEDWYRRALRNIDTLLQQRQGGDPRVGVSFVVSQHNHHEVADFCRMMLARAVDSVVVKYDIFSPMDFPDIPAHALADPRLEQRTLPGDKLGATGCVVPFFKVALNPYGELYSCCLGSQPGESNGYRLGSIRETWLGDVWATSRVLRNQMRVQGVHCSSCNHTDVRLNQALQGVA